jgi:hypothetical protein
MVRSVRLANERRYLAELAAYNPALIQILSHQSYASYDDIRFRLSASPALLKVGNELSVSSVHEGMLRFPRMFPSIPIEVYLNGPIFHPNVDPSTGFLCLWETYSPTYTSVDTLQQLRRILAWETTNFEATHLLQPDARDWSQSGRITFRLPLSKCKLAVPPCPRVPVLVRRNRLSPLEESSF